MWALLVLAMLSVLIATALTISFNYAQRSRSGVDAQQCYFTARSAAEAVARDIVDAQTPSLLPESASGEYPVSVKYDAELPDQMGVCTVSVVHKSKSAASVTATAKRGLSSYSYTVELAADSVVVPFFEGGLYVSALPNGSLIESVNRDLYISGSGASIIDFPVSGNVFAPYSDVRITGGGGVAGTIIAKSINYEGEATVDRFMPIAAISSGAGSQSQSLDNNITEQRMLSSEDYASLLAFDENPADAQARRFLVSNPTSINEQSIRNYSSLAEMDLLVFSYSTSTSFKTDAATECGVLMHNDFGRSKAVDIVINHPCSLTSFCRDPVSTLPTAFSIGDNASLTLSSGEHSCNRHYLPLIYRSSYSSDYTDSSFAGTDSSALTVNADTSLVFDKTTYLGTLNGAGSVVVNVGDAVDKKVEILSLGWKITGSEEGAE